MAFDLSGFLASEVHRPKTQLLFKRLVYLYLLGHALFFAPIFSLMFGSESVLMSWNMGDSPGFNLAGLIDHQRQLAVPAAVLYLVSLGLALMNLGGAVVRFLVFLLGVMFYYAGLPAFTASFILFNLFAAYLVFLNPKACQPVGVAFTNLAFMACQLQLVMVYALTGGYKLSGSNWLEGSALHHALHLAQYTPDWVRTSLDGWPQLTRVLSWFGMTYQLAFPVLVWWKRIKIPFLLLGVLFHTYIAIAMRLPEFGIGMILAYSLFLNNAQSESLNTVLFRWMPRP